VSFAATSPGNGSKKALAHSSLFGLLLGALVAAVEAGVTAGRSSIIGTSAIAIEFFWHPHGQLCGGTGAGAAGAGAAGASASAASLVITSTICSLASLANCGKVGLREISRHQQLVMNTRRVEC
jgi:hypothetical protein